MANSRAKREMMRNGGDYWVKDAFKPERKGALHRALGIASDKKIPTKKLQKALHSKNSLIRKEANLANVAKNFNHK